MKGKTILWGLIVFFTAVVAATVIYGAGARCRHMGMGGMGEMMSGRMQGCRMAGMGQPETPQIPLTQGRKEMGDEFICPVDGTRRTVAEDTPSTEYRGKTYYFCTQAEKRAFLQTPDRYAAGERAERAGR